MKCTFKEYETRSYLATTLSTLVMTETFEKTGQFRHQNGNCANHNDQCKYDIIKQNMSVRNLEGEFC